MKSLDEFKLELAIDKHNLDSALVEQPELYQVVAEEHVLAVSRRDELKDDLKRVEGELQIRIRKEAAEIKAKATEKSILSEVETHTEYIAAREAFLNACKEADLWQAMKESFIQRSYVLKDLTSLYISGYYAQTSVAGEGSRKVQEDQIQNHRKQIQRERVRLGEVKIGRTSIEEE